MRIKENLHLLLDVEGNKMTKDERKAEVPNTFSTPVFNNKTSCSECPELGDRDGKRNEAPHSKRK